MHETHCTGCGTPNGIAHYIGCPTRSQSPTEQAERAMLEARIAAAWADDNDTHTHTH